MCACMCVPLRVCLYAHARVCVCMCVKCGNKGIYLCTLLNYNCITVKKNTETDIHIKRTAWIIFHDFHMTHILYTLRITACLVPPQQIQIIKFIFRQWSCLTVCCRIWCRFFSSPKCNRSKRYHIWCTTFSCLLLHFEFLSSLLSFLLVPCLLKDHFASKPVNKHTTVHLKPHYLNLSHCYYIVQWKYNAIYNT